MARAAITATKLSADGIATTLVAASTDGNMFVNTGRTFIIVNNADAAEKDVTIITPGLVDGNVIADRVVTVPAGTERMIGPFQRDVYNQKSGSDLGQVYLDWEDFADATLAVFEP